MDKTLLPSGLYDLLPPFARAETELVQAFLNYFAGFGYEQVSPPLAEFEESLLSGGNAALAAQTFRAVDPQSQRMMGLRSDMTMQVARIALVRLAHLPRPLRLCYAGPTLRLSAEQLQNTRQPLQVGLELLGASTPAADAEVIGVAAGALAAAGLTGISVDLNLPGLLASLIKNDAAAIEKTEALQAAVAAKDVSAIEALRLRESSRIAALLRITGDAKTTLPRLAALLDMSETKPLVAALTEIITQLKRSCPTLSITLDPLESHDLAYHQGIRFSLFVETIRHEIGRGGRYIATAPNGEKEEATGCTIYADRLLERLVLPSPKEKIFVPAGTAFTETENLRAQGFATLHGAENTANTAAEAKRLGCQKIYTQRGVEPLIQE